MNCFSADNRIVVLTNAIQRVTPVPDEGRVFELQGYSSLAKLMRVATYLFKFVNKLRRNDRDPTQCTQISDTCNCSKISS